MVIISAAIVTKARTLLARQYLEVSRLQVEGLLSAFTKLVDGGRGDSSGGVKSDHTFVETDSVRFVYQPMESGLYLVLMTTKSSNIIENLETLRLISRLTQEICHANPASSSTQASITNEETIVQNAFDLVFAFDEAISFGYREHVTAAQINQYVEMESHEERLHQMIQQSKENEAKETARRKQLELAELRKKQQKEDKMAASMSPVSTTGGGGVGSSSVGGGGAYETSMDGSGAVEKFDRQRRQEDLLARQAALVAAAAARGPAEPMATWNPTMNTEAVDYTVTTTTAAAPKRGMALGGAGRRRIDQ
jgi:hypothetical protein